MSKYYYEQWEEDVRFGIDSELVISEKSDFQEIEFFDSKTFGRFMTIDGLMMVTERDEFIYHDMIVHPAMAVNPEIQRVLVIGGGDGGTVRELLRYKNICEIVMCEIDEKVFRLSQEYFKITAEGIEEDERTTLVFDDGVKYVRDALDNSFDLILVDSTDPISVGEGLFSTSFYKDCYRILSDDGILINQKENAFFDKYREEMKKSHEKTKEIFEICETYQYVIPTYPSAHWLFGFCSKKYHPIVNLQKEIWENLNLKTKYYNTELHIGAFLLPTYIKEQLDE